MPVWPERPVIISLQFLQHVACAISPVALDSLAVDFFTHSVNSSAAHTHTHTLCPLHSSAGPPLLHWITFLVSANWSHMSGIPQTKGFYFLLHKDPYCTQQAQILGRVKEKWRGSLKPYLVSKGKLNHTGICRLARRDPLATVVIQCMN